MEKMIIESQINTLTPDTKLIELDFNSHGIIIFNGKPGYGKSIGIFNIIEGIIDKYPTTNIVEYGAQYNYINYNNITQLYTYVNNNDISIITETIDNRHEEMNDKSDLTIFDNNPFIVYLNKPTDITLELLKPYYQYLRSAHIILIIETQFVSGMVKQLLKYNPIIFNFKVNSERGILLPPTVNLEKEYNPLNFKNSDIGKALYYCDDNLALMKFSYNKDEMIKNEESEITLIDIVSGYPYLLDRLDIIEERRDRLNHDLDKQKAEVLDNIEELEKIMKDAGATSANETQDINLLIDYIKKNNI